MFKLMDELKRSTPERRITLLTRLHAKNVAFFARLNPQMSDFVKARGTGTFEIKVTQSGIEILDKQGKNQYHPAGQLFQYMSELGAWHHSGWVDKVHPLHINRGDNDHGRAVVRFVNAIYADFPGLGSTVKANSEIQLPAMRDGRRFSSAVVFLGVFTGLHIMYYLNRTEARDVFLIEPDLDRFALSCYFLDYEQIEKLSGRLLLHVGPDVPQNPIDLLVTRAPVTASAWVRLLPAYTDGKFDDVLDRVSLRWRALFEIFVPFDREVRNLQYGWQNIKNGQPFLHEKPSLSKNSIIAVVASGPSLAADIGWLRDNQSKLIIFSSISSVRVLKENGIQVDYQCTLDTEIEDPLLESLGLDTEIPLMAYYKLDPKVAARFKKVFLVPEEHKANVVRFRTPIHYTHPTTGNLMVAVAAWLKPARILLLGLDLGFREAKQSHVKGGWHDENEGSGHDEETGGRDHIKVRANFDESDDQILTMSYYNNARFHIEDAIRSLGEDVEVLNLADGARVTGANAKRSSELKLSQYRAKKGDIRALESAFSDDPSKVWEPFEITGKQLIDETMSSLMVNVSLPGDFAWLAWAQALDGAWEKTLMEMLPKHRDLRIEIFSKLVYDLLAEWYKSALLADAQDVAEKIYIKGLKELREELDLLVWPVDLDEPLSDALLQKSNENN